MPDTTQTLDVYKSTLTSQQVDDALKRILQINIPDIIQKQDLFDMVYPVGSIYMSINNVSPATFLGGTWQQIQGRFLLAASSTYPAGSTGGEATHTLSIDEIPSHGPNLNGGWGEGGTDSGQWRSDQNKPKTSWGMTQPRGGGQAHNNMPPYLSVYMWQRTA